MCASGWMLVALTLTQEAPLRLRLVHKTGSRARPVMFKQSFKLGYEISSESYRQRLHSLRAYCFVGEALAALGTADCKSSRGVACSTDQTVHLLLEKIGRGGTMCDSGWLLHGAASWM